METQQAFDEFVKTHGAEATVAAIRGHVHADGGTKCVADSDCPKGYICSGGQCVLDVG